MDKIEVRKKVNTILSKMNIVSEFNKVKLKPRNYYKNIELDLKEEQRNCK